MVDALKWLGLVATILSLVVVILSSVFSIPYVQALINLLVGEFVVIALAHSTYRISSGKQASPMAAGVAIVGGIVLAATPYLFARFDPYLTIQLVCSLLIVASGIGVFADRIVGGEEGRQTGAQRIAGRSSS
ncbi:MULTISPECIES: hypothetical protein [Haloarcula]|uniref:hypothetical protein n=1 Tax=Haloarcula TaxID=2237 RepID=UPI0023EAC4D7|nr:hypothetical protein [Halomicroarcula sp. XH51]